MVSTACQLEEGESGRKALKTDRIEAIKALSSHLVERFQKVLDDPILEAFSIFDVRKWPADKGVLKESYIDGIRLLYETYKIFYAAEETEEMVLEQWEDLKAEINVPTLAHAHLSSAVGKHARTVRGRVCAGAAPCCHFTAHPR